MGKSKAVRRPEVFDGSFAGIPHAILDSLSFKGATDGARSLLFPIIRQLNGMNNGHLHLSAEWLKKQGYTSSSVYKYRKELIERELIVQTKWGGLGIGASLYAVTWLPITNYVGLDISENEFRRGGWARCQLPPTPRRPKPQNKNQDSLNGNRNSEGTTTVVEKPSLVTTTVSKMCEIDGSSTTTTVNNVVNTNTPHQSNRRTVGVKGRSGVKRDV